VGQNKALIINLFAGPGAGKSTTAAGVFYELKLHGINCELITEYAKQVVWAENFKTLDDQLYVFAKQQHKLFTTADKVDVIITDAPLLLSLYYGKHLSDTFRKLVIETASQYNNINYFVKRVKPYNPAGRFQNEEEAKDIDAATFAFLRSNDIQFNVIDGNRNGVNKIVKSVLDTLSINDLQSKASEKPFYNLPLEERRRVMEQMLDELGSGGPDYEIRRQILEDMRDNNF
jgi:hypothetical protein